MTIEEEMFISEVLPAFRKLPIERQSEVIEQLVLMAKAATD